MGSDSLVWLKLAGQILSARVESSQIYKPNEKITGQIPRGPRFAV